MVNETTGGGGGALPHMSSQVAVVYFPAVQLPGICLHMSPKQVYVPFWSGGLASAAQVPLL